MTAAVQCCHGQARTFDMDQACGADVRFTPESGKPRRIVSAYVRKARYDAAHRFKEITMPNHGGCLCGALRFATRGNPLRVTICHCKFCQRATGSAYMVEPIFEKTSLEITSGTPAT